MRQSKPCRTGIFTVTEKTRGQVMTAYDRKMPVGFALAFALSAGASLPTFAHGGGPGRVSEPRVRAVLAVRPPLECNSLLWPLLIRYLSSLRLPVAKVVQVPSRSSLSTRKSTRARASERRLDLTLWFEIETPCRDEQNRGKSKWKTQKEDCMARSRW